MRQSPGWLISQEPVLLLCVVPIIKTVIRSGYFLGAYFASDSFYVEIFFVLRDGGHNGDYKIMVRLLLPESSVIPCYYNRACLLTGADTWEIDPQHWAKIGEQL